MIRNQNINDTNIKLRNDLERCKMHLQCVIKNNELLGNSIEEFTYVDERVTKIIKRNDLKNLWANFIRLSFTIRSHYINLSDLNTLLILIYLLALKFEFQVILNDWLIYSVPLFYQKCLSRQNCVN